MNVTKAVTATESLWNIVQWRIYSEKNTNVPQARCKAMRMDYDKDGVQLTMECGPYFVAYRNL